MDQPLFDGRERYEELRRERGFAAVAAGLWHTGRLEGLRLPCVAIVGTRAATRYGIRLAHEFASELGAAGCCIVSGLALGIDTAAHEGALSAGAPTVAVLGSGHRRLFPARNRSLAERILAGGGAVLSPYSPDHDPFPGQFLARNGIVAAISDAVVVIEAPARSGALNTAGWAAGRIPVLAVPGDVDRKHVAGCLALIRDGAILARGAGDVLEALGRAAPPSRTADDAASGDGPDSVGARVIRALDAGAIELDVLIAAAGAQPAEVLAVLTLLELEGRVERSGASTYARRR
ncbi:MAG: DNA-processing protein DprA [Candidatus Eremiobacteraeota bacterium]|nr:DNA-processing protein DprA [Candidatus Eremiobacteraeota bacterium]